MPKPPEPPPRRSRATLRALVISPDVTVRWVGGTLTVSRDRGQSIESRDPTLLWLLNEFAAPKLPAQVATSLPGTPPAALETAIADLQATGILVPAPPHHTSVPPPAPSSRRRHLRRGTGPGDESRPQLSASVVLPTRNRARQLDYALASYLEQSDDRFELVIVDDGSRDDTHAVVERYDDHLTIQYLRQDPAGLAAARNAGLRLACGDILIFTDEDRIVGPEFVERHLASYHSSTDQRCVLGWSGLILPALDEDLMGPMFPVLSAKLRPKGSAESGALTLFEPADLTRHFQTTVGEFGTLDNEYEKRMTPALEQFGDDLEGLALGWFLGSTGNLSLPRHLLGDVGEIDERYEDRRIGDVDFCYAAARSGAEAQVERSAVSYRQLSPPLDSPQELERSLSYFHRKHDRLEALLFLWWWTGGLELQLANQIALTARSGRATADPVLAALQRAIGELVDAKLRA